MFLLFRCSLFRSPLLLKSNTKFLDKWNINLNQITAHLGNAEKLHMMFTENDAKTVKKFDVKNSQFNDDAGIMYTWLFYALLEY